MKCKECGQELNEDAMFCGKCGKPTSSSRDKIKCEECGFKIDSNLEYCPKCGKSTYSRGYDKKRRKREEDDDDDEGGILGGIGDFLGKIFGG